MLPEISRSRSHTDEGIVDIVVQTEGDQQLDLEVRGSPIMPIRDPPVARSRTDHIQRPVGFFARRGSWGGQRPHSDSPVRGRKAPSSYYSSVSTAPGSSLFRRAGSGSGSGSGSGGSPRAMAGQADADSRLPQAMAFAGMTVLPRSPRSRGTPSSSTLTLGSGVPRDTSLASVESMPRTLTGCERHTQAALRFSDPRLLRGSTAASVLHRGGYVFGDQPCTTEYYDMSDRVPYLDMFVSHNWSTPRRSKFLMLCLHFNLGMAWLMASLAMIVPLVLQASGIWRVEAVVGWDSSVHARACGCQAVGLVVFVVTLLTWHEVTLLCCRRRGPRLFLDKTCVHQTDVELKRQGIANIAAFLSHSASMIVLYSDQYLEKLWTVYEIASFSMLFPNGRLYLRPVILSTLTLTGISLVTIIRWINQFTHGYFQPVSDIICGDRDDPVISDASCGSCVGFIVHHILPLPFTLAMSMVCYQWAYQRSEILKKLRNFSCSDAKCQSEDDRHIVESNIAIFAVTFKFVPAGTRKADVLELFDAHVHSVLPQLLRSSFGKAGVPYAFACTFFIAYFFQIFDLLATTIYLEEHLQTKLVAILFSNLALCFILGPLGVAAFIGIPRLAIDQCSGRCCAIVTTLILTLITHWSIDLAIFLEMHYLLGPGLSKEWLVLHMVLLMSMGIFTYLIYKPANVVHPHQVLDHMDMRNDVDPMPILEVDEHAASETGSGSNRSGDLEAGASLPEDEEEEEEDGMVGDGSEQRDAERPSPPDVFAPSPSRQWPWARGLAASFFASGNDNSNSNISHNISNNLSNSNSNSHTNKNDKDYAADLESASDELGDSCSSESMGGSGSGSTTDLETTAAVSGPSTWPRLRQLWPLH
mmetsp:Transcript_80998/g.169101  ORF Transcript_80998/g.169101 Transcript_80998/m.169101 type:complete len:869 (+) Transcript_80998:240-2846(+)